MATIDQLTAEIIGTYGPEEATAALTRALAGRAADAHRAINEIAAPAPAPDGAGDAIPSDASPAAPPDGVPDTPAPDPLEPRLRRTFHAAVDRAVVDVRDELGDPLSPAHERVSAIIHAEASDAIAADLRDALANPADHELAAALTAFVARELGREDTAVRNGVFDIIEDWWLRWEQALLANAIQRALSNPDGPAAEAVREFVWGELQKVQAVAAVSVALRRPPEPEPEPTPEE